MTFKCSKCTETMNSKCPDLRSVFPRNQSVAMFKNTLVTKTQPYSPNSDSVCLAIEWGIAPAGETKQQMWAGMVNELRAMTDEEVKILICDHEWYLPEGQVCSLEGHEHNRRD